MGIRNGAEAVLCQATVTLALTGTNSTNGGLAVGHHGCKLVEHHEQHCSGAARRTGLQWPRSARRCGAAHAEEPALKRCKSSVSGRSDSANFVKDHENYYMKAIRCHTRQQASRGR
jgi:hypothetical protein